MKQAIPNDLNDQQQLRAHLENMSIDKEELSQIKDHLEIPEEYDKEILEQLNGKLNKIIKILTD